MKESQRTESPIVTDAKKKKTHGTGVYESNSLRKILRMVTFNVLVWFLWHFTRLPASHLRFPSETHWVQNCIFNEMFTSAHESWRIAAPTGQEVESSEKVSTWCSLVFLEVNSKISHEDAKNRHQDSLFTLKVLQRPSFPAGGALEQKPRNLPSFFSCFN